MKPIIHVENLSKQYTLGATSEPYSTLRESLVKAARKPLDMVRRGNKAESSKFWALKGVSFDVMPGDVVGIIGRNGAGKSTPLKILSRITEPTTGRAELYGRVGSLLEVGTGFHPELTGRENIYLNGAILGMRRAEIEKKFDEIVDFAEIEEFLDTPVKRYSSGMYVRLAFAVSAHLEPEILIVDEVLAVGDAQFQKKCLGKMKDVSEHGRTVIFVSHNMHSIYSLCTSGFLLSEGILVERGDIDKVVNSYLATATSNYKEFDGALRWAKIEQVEDTLELECEYDTSLNFDVPYLGFVISNCLGVPIFGSNPGIEHVRPNMSASLQGRIKIVVRQPKLLDGEYLVSLWFGDGTVNNVFEEKDVLSIEVIGMTDKGQLPPVIVGNAVPECDWTFA